MRRGRVVWRLLVLAVAVLVAAVLVHLQAAWATDCTEITDCLANDVRGSIAALAGVALLIGLFVAPEVFGPILIAKGIAEAVTGKDLLTGQPLDWTDRALGVLPVFGEYGQEARTAEEVASEGEQLAPEIAGWSAKDVNPGFPAPGRVQNCANCAVAMD